MRKRPFQTVLMIISLNVCVFPQGPGAQQQLGDMVTMKTSALSLTIKKSPAPYFYRLVHGATGTSVVSSAPQPVLFAIVLAGPHGQDYVESSRARATTLNVYRTTAGSQVIMTFSDFPNLDLSAVVRGVVSDDRPLTSWTIGVRNRTGRTVDYVRFPYICATPAIGEAADDFIVVPNLPGTLFKTPAKTWAVNDGVWLRYPGELSAQFITYQDPSAGIYLASMDPEGFEKRLAIWKRDDGFALCHDYFLSADAAEDWQCPYPVVIGVTQGTWQDSADMYKTWAVTQRWCARTLSERDDIPAWWRRGPLVYTSSMRTYDEQGIETGSWYPRLLESLRNLKGKTGGQIVAMLADWENHRRWTAGDYFPIFDQQNARNAITRIKADGYRPFFFLSGLFYTFMNEGINGSVIPVPEEYMSQFVEDPTTGRPQVFTMDESSPSALWKRHSYAFCVTQPAVTAFFRSVIDRTLDLGVSILQMDQMVSGAGMPCSSSAHGHVPGIGLYQTKDFQTLIDNMREYGKSRDPDFLLFSEEPHEQLIPHLDGFHTREYMEGQWYRGLPGAVGIPLFTYLYHEYAICYGGDSAHIGIRGVNPAWYTRHHAVNLVTGKAPGAATWFFPQELFDSDPRPVAMIRKHALLLKAGANRYLMDGKMLHPFEIRSPQLLYTETRYAQGVPTLFEFAESSILTSSWQAPDGGVGHFFVNLGKKQTLTVDLDTRNVPGGGLYDVSLYRSEDQATVPLWSAVTLPRRFTTTILADEIIHVEIRALRQ